ncbi:MAG: fatty acid desaturase, partial [Nitrosomonadaceae bacterium]
LVTLQGFSLKIDSINTLRQNTKATRLDQFVLLLHLLLWFGLPVYLLGAASATLNYFFITWLIGPYLGAVFLVNHIGTRVIAPDENMPVFCRNLTTTRNLGGSRVESFIWGGMNNHIEHHLFPTIPTTRLSQARVVVKKFCKLHGLPYRERSWFEGICEVFSYLKQISRLEKKRSMDLHSNDGTLPRNSSGVFL